MILQPLPAQCAQQRHRAKPGGLSTTFPGTAELGAAFHTQQMKEDDMGAGGGVCVQPPGQN